MASQRGDIATLTSLLNEDSSLATARDAQNITPLHWAAINAHIPACLLLLQHGAEVDALGGDLVATPLQWAARNGYIYVMQLLVEWGADPGIRDSQGYNSLHLATHSSGVMPLVYLLNLPDETEQAAEMGGKKGVATDSRDSQGHTSLMWACYQGDAISASLLLRHGANPNARDDAGLTPLHWAVVRANRTIIRKLVETGADLSAKDGEGRTAKEMAAELKSAGAFKRALEEGGLDELGRSIKKPLSEVCWQAFILSFHRLTSSSVTQRLRSLSCQLCSSTSFLRRCLCCLGIPAFLLLWQNFSACIMWVKLNLFR